MRISSWRPDALVVATAIAVAVIGLWIGLGGWAFLAAASAAVAGSALPAVVAVVGRRALPPAGSPERTLVNRARRARRTVRRLATATKGTPLAQRCAAFEHQLGLAEGRLRQLAIQAAERSEEHT